MSERRSLVGRDSELHLLNQLFDNIHGHGGSLGVTGGPGVGKSALLAEAAEWAAERGMLVLSATGVQAEASQAFAGLHQLLRPVLGHLSSLPPPQCNAIQAAFGLADGPTPDLFLTALAALDLLADSAARAPVVVLADDAQWLDRSTKDVLAFIARRLDFEPVVLIAAVLDGYPGQLDAWQQVLHLDPLPRAAAGALLDARAPGLPEAVRDQVLEEAAGNPLALVELPVTLGKVARVPVWLPLTTRLQQAFAARAFDLPAPTRTALLVAALDDGPLLSEVLDATALLIGKVSPLDVLAPAVDARLVKTDGTNLSFRHPLMRTAIRQEASISQLHAAHAALASILTGQPERQVWHRAASIIGPDEAVAVELEVAAARARRRGGTAVAIAALGRAADLGDDPHRPGRLLSAAELAFELGQHDLVRSLLSQAEPLGLSPRDQWRLTWIRESFGDGVPGAPTNARLLATAAGQASADGDTLLAIKLLNGAAQRCWWAEPGQATREQVVATAERLDVEESDPRLLVILAYAAPVERGAEVINRLSGILPTVEPGTGAVRLAAIAATAVGAFDLATGLHAAAVTGLRSQGRLGLLARALFLQAWGAAQLADLGTAIPAAEEARRLAQETRQPLITASAQAVQAILAGLRGQHEAAEALAAQAERVSVPIGASATMAAALLGRGLAALGDGRPADALAHLRRIHDRSDPAFHAGIRCHTVGDLAEAALRGGAPGSIAGLMQEMETAARQTPSPSLHAGLRYARALLAPAADAQRLFEEALRSDMSALPFWRARVQLAYGELLHQQRQDTAARAPLRAAREAFDALGVLPWSDRARQQLRATGEKSRPRTPEARDQLTPQELQIIQMAAEGLSNREIGEKLYLSHRTVGSHLYRAFPKLGITSRTELRAALGLDASV